MSEGIISTPSHQRAQSGAWDVYARLVSMWRTVRDGLRRRRDRRALALLDDRTLSDIGIGPGEVDHAVRHGRRDAVVHSVMSR